MNRRGFLAVLAGAPIAARLAPVVHIEKSRQMLTPNLQFEWMHYTQEQRIPFGWRDWPQK